MAQDDKIGHVSNLPKSFQKEIARDLIKDGALAMGSEARGVLLLLELLPEQVEVVAGLHLRPYYGDEDETDGLYHSEAKDGATAFHAYATLYARARNKRYTLAVRRLQDGDTASSVLAEFLGVLEGLDLGVKAVYLDSEFYDGKCLTLLRAHNVAYVTPIIRWDDAIKDELSRG